MFKLNIFYFNNKDIHPLTFNLKFFFLKCLKTIHDAFYNEY